MTSSLIDIFEIVKTCEYRGEIYLVRDNGAVYRYRKSNIRKRPLDEKWTFGKLDSQKGYFNISSESVHRIVATAFHGIQPSEKHVIDHIDTNKQNNRPENLRWVTRLDNILLNPITLSKVIFKYGSIDNFLSDPSKPLDGILDQNFDWMRTVTKEEAENTKNNLLKWAKEGKVPSGGALGDWVFSNYNKTRFENQEPNNLIQSLTKNALQKNWSTPTEFPECPTEFNAKSLISYKNSLNENGTFAKNIYGISKVISSDYYEAKEKLFVLTYNPDPEADRKFYLACIFIENEKYIHESLGGFFERKGAEKQFHLVRDLEWEGGDSIDDYL